MNKVLVSLCILSLGVSAVYGKTVHSDPLGEVDTVYLSVVYGGSLGGEKPFSITDPELFKSLDPCLLEMFTKAFALRAISVDDSRKISAEDSEALNQLSFGIFGHRVRPGNEELATFLVELEFEKWLDESLDCNTSLVDSSAVMDTVLIPNLRLAILETAARSLNRLVFNSSYCNQMELKGTPCKPLNIEILQCPIVGASNESLENFH